MMLANRARTLAVRSYPALRSHHHRPEASVLRMNTSIQSRLFSESNKESPASSAAAGNAVDAGKDAAVKTPAGETAQAQDAGKPKPPPKKINPVKLRLPDDNANTPPASINKWTKELGERVKESEPLCEIENDHFTYDFQSTVSGWLAAILARNGAKKVPPGEVIAVLAEEKEEIPAVVEMIEREIKAGTLRVFLAPPPSPDPPTAPSNPPEASDKAGSKSSPPITPSDTPAAPQSEVAEFLNRVHAELLVYEAVLRSDGFDSVDALETLKEEDLEKLGMKTGHRRILMSFLEKRKSNAEAPKQA